MRNHLITIFIGIGSNLGEREANLKHAIALLEETPGLEVRKVSSFLDNPAVGGAEDAPPCLNAAIEAVTHLSAHALMKRFLEIEQQMGRERREKWEPRLIDLDLLMYGDQIISSDNLIVPHPLMHERKFVLQPLAEIAPQAIHPTLQMSVSGLLEGLKGT